MSPDEVLAGTEIPMSPDEVLAGTEIPMSPDEVLAGTEIPMSSEEVLAGTKILGTGRRWISRLYLTLYCHHQNDSYVKTVSDESHINVSFILKDEVTKTEYVYSYRQVLKSRSRIEPKSFCLPAQRLTARPTRLPFECV